MGRGLKEGAWVWASLPPKMQDIGPSNSTKVNSIASASRIQLSLHLAFARSTLRLPRRGPQGNCSTAKVEMGQFPHFEFAVLYEKERYKS